MKASNKKRVNGTPRGDIRVNEAPIRRYHANNMRET